MTKIVILHGWGHNSSYWESFIYSFGPGNVVIFDLPGFGTEPLVADDWNVPQYAEWVKQKIRQMGLTNVILLGHSFGGRIASCLAADQPEWLRGLILYASPSLYRPSSFVTIRISLARFFKLLKGSGISNNPELEAADNAGMGKIFRNVVKFDQTQILPDITVPTLLLWGENDADVSPKIAEEMHELISNSKLVILENVGHNVHLENPHLFYGTVKNFVETL